MTNETNPTTVWLVQVDDTSDREPTGPNGRAFLSKAGALAEVRDLLLTNVDEDDLDEEDTADLDATLAALAATLESVDEATEFCELFECWVHVVRAAVLP